MAGGGVRGGTVHGEIDESGMSAVTGAVSAPGRHATILRLPGFDHEEPFFERNGARETLAVVTRARVEKDIPARASACRHRKRSTPTIRRREAGDVRR